MMEVVAYAPRRVASYTQSRFHAESGAGLVEYVLLVALIAIVALIAVQTFGGAVEDKFDEVSDSVANAGG